MTAARTNRGRRTIRHRPVRNTRYCAPQPHIDVLVQSSEWRRHVLDVAKVAQRAAKAALAGRRSRGRLEVCLVLADNSEMRRLNRTWRGMDKPTNVLSFPALSPGRTPPPRWPARLRLPLGDVVIASGVTINEAKAQGKPVDAHLAHLVVHGVLHLLGHDHEEDAEASRMEALETRILRRLGVANPYRNL